MEKLAEPVATPFSALSPEDAALLRGTGKLVSGDFTVYMRYRLSRTADGGADMSTALPSNPFAFFFATEPPLGTAKIGNMFCVQTTIAAAQQIPAASAQASQFASGVIDDNVFVELGGECTSSSMIKQMEFYEEAGRKKFKAECSKGFSDDILDRLITDMIAVKLAVQAGKGELKDQIAGQIRKSIESISDEQMLLVTGGEKLTPADIADAKAMLPFLQELSDEDLALVCA